MKHFSLTDPSNVEIAKMLESKKTPSLEKFQNLFTKHIQGALGGEQTSENVRNFKYLRMFFETFNDHKQYANTLREYSGYRIEETFDETEGPGDFDDYDASADQADDEYVDNHGFGGSDDDE